MNLRRLLLCRLGFRHAPDPMRAKVGGAWVWRCRRCWTCWEWFSDRREVREARREGTLQRVTVL